jgi:hypothetical protein
MKWFFSSLAAAASLCLPFHSHGQEPGGLRVATVLHDDGTRTVTTFDPDQHTSSQETYSGEKLLKKIVFTLDETNRPVSGVLYSGKGKPVRKVVYKYDALNRLDEEQDYTLDGQLIGRFVYDYDKNGRVSRIRAFDAGGKQVSASTVPAKKAETGQPAQPPRH